MKIKFFKSLSKFILEFLDLWVLILLIPCFSLFFIMYDSPLRNFLCFSITLIGLVLSVLIVQKYRPGDERRNKFYNSISEDNSNSAEIKRNEYIGFINKDKY